MRAKDAPGRSVDRLRNEQATDALVSGHIHWCRAKLLHALAGAAAQGVLGEVVDELLPEAEDLGERLVAALRDTGWLPPSG